MSIIRRNGCIYATFGILLFCIASCLVCTLLSDMQVGFQREYQTVIHTEQQVPSVAKTQLFLLMMGP